MESQRKAAPANYDIQLNSIAEDITTIANGLVEKVPNEAKITDAQPVKAILLTVLANASRVKVMSIISRKGEAVSLLGIAMNSAKNAKIYIVIDNVDVDPDGFDFRALSVPVNKMIPMRYTAQKQIDIYYSEFAGAAGTEATIFYFERRPWTTEESKNLSSNI